MSCTAGQLRELVYSSGLSIREFASALGVSSQTIVRHLMGRRSSRRRQTWYRNVERIFVDRTDGTIHIVVAYCAPTRKPCGWSPEWRRKKQARRGYHGGRL